MRDHIIRAAFHQSILKDAHFCSDTQVIDELGIKNGEVRADIAVLNGKLIGYEIKTDNDNLKRLPHQVVAYSDVFEKVYIVTGSKHLDNVIKVIPEWWGIYLIEISSNGDPYFSSFRKARVNKKRNAYSLAQLLWKDELAEILNKVLNQTVARRTTKTDMYDLLASNFSINKVSKLVLKYMKTRNSWRINR